MWLLDTGYQKKSKKMKQRGWKLELLDNSAKTFYMTMMIWINYLKVRAILLIQKEDSTAVIFASSFHNVASLYGRH